MFITKEGCELYSQHTDVQSFASGDDLLPVTVRLAVVVARAIRLQDARVRLKYTTCRVRTIYNLLF